jgi:uncharacterized protein YndB with AHSA1/START domain
VSTTRVTTVISAPRDRVYAVLLDPEAVGRWKVPEGMTCVVHEFDPREGGALRVSLTYEDEDRAGKTTGRTDTYRGRFVTLVPGELVVEADEFESADAALGGEMVSTIRLRDVPGGTELEAVHEGVPDAVDPALNELGWREALGRLARLVEAAP